MKNKAKHCGKFKNLRENTHIQISGVKEYGYTKQIKNG
jgi:hypothetical protein